jgi:hypothetical protein
MMRTQLLGVQLFRPLITFSASVDHLYYYYYYYYYYYHHYHYYYYYYYYYCVMLSLMAGLFFLVPLSKRGPG